MILYWEKRKASMKKFFSAATNTVLGESVHLHIKEGVQIRVALDSGRKEGCRQSLGKGTGSEGGR